MKFKENVKTIFQYETKKNELKYNLNKKILIKIVIHNPNTNKRKIKTNSLKAKLLVSRFLSVNFFCFCGAQLAFF